jgi:hypothetical protein
VSAQASVPEPRLRAVATFAIRVPTVDDLLDPYSVEPLERRPLTAEVRQRILESWIDVRRERPSQLTVRIPAEEVGPEFAESLRAAIGNDLVATSEVSRRLRIFTRGQRREAWLAFGFLIVCLLASGAIDSLGGTDALLDGVSQGLVVLGWVALWRPAEQAFRGISRWLSRNRYRELAQIDVEIKRV